MIFVVGGSSAMLSMAMVWWTGGKVDAILLSMPSLVYVLGLSGGIHIINYYRDEVRARGQAGAAGRALKHAALPCTLASFTTAIGLISLYTSNLKPISGFGLYAAIGVMSTLGVLFSYLPAALVTFQPKVEGSDEKVVPEGPRVESKMSDWWANIGRTIAGNQAVVTVSCMVVLVLAGLGMREIKTSVQLLELFDPSARIIRDYAWLEENFGKLVPMEVVVRMPPNMQSEALAEAGLPASTSSLNLLERVEAVSRIRKVVHRTLGEPGRDIVGQSTSSDTFLPPLPAPSNSPFSIRPKFNNDLAAASDQLRDNDYLKIEKSGDFKGSELWRISLRVAALSDVDYGNFVSTLRDAVSPVLCAYETRDDVVNALTTTTDDGRQKIVNKATLLMVGASKPSSLDEMPLISEDGSVLLSRNAYLATLGELLANEKIKDPKWLNLSVEETKSLLASERWDKIVSSFDTVVWLGGDGYVEKDFASAKKLVDARGAEVRITESTLLADRTPTVIGGGPIQAIYTGVIPVVYKAQRTLLTSLADSIALAFVLIAIVMVILLNPGSGPAEWIRPKNFAYGFAAGMVAMIPNVFPVILVFGLMCHLGIEIDIGTMMTASVAMGVAVDDTIHYLAWFRENLDKGKSRYESVIETYRRVGPAMTQTTIVGGLGLFVFALSTFTPTQRFGTLMLVMLFAALIGDLVLLPALLAGPLGRVFKPRCSPGGTSTAGKHDGAEELLVQGVANEDPASNEASASSEAPPSVISSMPIDVDSIPSLRVHFPPERSNSGNRVKRK